MSNVVEDRIINLKFNNKDFEKNAAQSMRTIDALEEKLTFKSLASKGVDAFKGIINAASQIPSTLERIADAGSLGMVSKIKAAFTRNGDLFSPLLEMATGAFRQIGQEAYSLGKQITTSLTTQQIDAGWEKYADKTQSVQTIMNATGKSIDEVTEALDKLNWYSDETSYSYTDMTSNIARFTSSGVDLNTAVTAMIGIGNAAGLAGAKVQDASHAMAGFAKAIGQGYMDRIKWSWIESAQMDTQQFKKSLIEAAVALGTLRSNGDGTFSSANGKNLTSIENFENDLATGKWMTAEVMLRALQDYGDLTNEIYDIYQASGGEKSTSEILEELGVAAEDLGLKSLKASQEAKTFADAIESVKDATSTRWMETFDIIFGNYEEARKLWTDFANWLYSMFVDSALYRNEQFEIFMGRRAIDKETGEYYRIGDQMLSGREYFLQAIYKFMEVITAYADAIKMAWDRTFGAWDFNTIGEIAKRIHRIAEILGATLQKDLAMDPKKVSELEWIDNQNRNSFIVKFRLAMERFFIILKESVETLKTMGQTFYEALYEAFGDSNDRSHGFYISGFYKWFSDVTMRVVNFIKTFRTVLTQNDRFKRILSGNFAILKIFFNILQNAVDYIIQNGGGIIAIIAEVLASLGDFAVSFDQSNLYDFINGLFPLINSLSAKILKAVLSILGVLGKAKDFLLDFFNGLDKRVGESGSLQKLADGFANLGKSISNLLGLDKLGQFFESFNLQSTNTSFVDVIVAAVDNAIVALANFFNIVASGIDKVKAFGDTLAGVAANIGTSISGIVGSLFGSKIGGTRGMPGLEENKVSIFDAIREKASGMLTNMFKDVNNEEVTRGATEYTGSIISGIIEALKNAVNNLDSIGIDFEKIKFLGYFVGFIVTLINVNKTLKSADDLVSNVTSIPEAISKAITNWGGIGAGIKNLLDELKESLDELVELEKLQTMAKVISTMSLIVMLLSSIPEQDLAKGVVYLGIIGAIFVAFNKAMGAVNALANVNVVKNVGNITKSMLSGNTISWNSGPLGWASVIIAMASLISSFVAAVNTMTTVDGKDVALAAGVILGIIGAFGLIIGLLGKLGAQFTTSAYSRTETFGSNGKKSESENKLSGTSGKFFYGIAAAFLALSAGIKIVVDAIKVLSDQYLKDNHATISATVAVFSIIAVMFAAVFLLLTAAVNLLNDPSVKEERLKNMGKTMILLAAGIAIIVVAINLIVPSIIALAVAFRLVHDPSSVGLAMGTIAGLLVIVFGAMIWILNVLKKTDAGKIRVMGKAMILIGASMAIVIASMAILVGAIIALVVVFTAQSGISKLLKDNSIITLAIITVAGIMVAVMVFMGVMINQLRDTSDSKISLIGDVMIKIAETMIAMAGAIFIIAISMAIVAKSGATIEHGLGIAAIIVAAALSLIGSLYVINKLGVKPNEIIALSQAFLSIAGAVVMMALAVAVISLINPDTIGGAFKNMLITLAAVTAAVIILALIAKFVPGTEIVLGEFAAILIAIATMMASVAAMAFGFALSVAVVTKSIVPLTEALGPFTVAFVGFLEGIKGHGFELIAMSVALSVFAGTIAAIVVVALYLIIRYRSQIGAALADGFNGIKHIIDQFGTWFSGLPKKTQLMIKSFALAISAGLVSATPEMYAQIEAGFMLLMERLGDSVGWIVEGLLALVINIVNGLADAIRNNAPILAYAIWNAIYALVEVIIDFLAPMLANLLAPIELGLEMLADPQSYFEKVSTLGGYDEVQKLAVQSVMDTFREARHAMAAGLEEIAKLYDVDPTKQLETLSKSNHDKYVAEIESGKTDIENKVKDATSSIGDAAVSGLDSSKNKIDNYLKGIGKDLSFDSLKKQVLGGANISDIAKNFIGEDGMLDTSMFDEFTNALSLDGVDTTNWTNFAASAQTADQSMVDLNQDTSDFIQLSDNTSASYDNSAEAADRYYDSIKNAEDAEEAFGNDTDSMVRAVEAREDSFYSAGEKLATAVENGINSKWSTISWNITSKFQKLSDDIRSMLEMGDLTVGISNVVPVYNGDSAAVPRNTAPATSLWNDTAGGNAMTNDPRYSVAQAATVGGYYAAQEAYGDMLAKNVHGTMEKNKANKDAYDEFLGNKVTDLYDEFHEYNTKFGAFSEGAQAYYNKDPNIYLDKDVLVGTFSEELKEPFLVSIARKISNRGD